MTLGPLHGVIIETKCRWWCSLMLRIILRQYRREIISCRNDPSAFQSAYGPRCVRITVYFVLIIAPRIYASSMVRERGIYADIILVQISEIPGDVCVCVHASSSPQTARILSRVSRREPVGSHW